MKFEEHLDTQVKVRAFGRIHFCLVNLSNEGHLIHGGAGMMISPASLTINIQRSNQLVVENPELLNEVLFVCSQISAKKKFRISADLFSPMKPHYGIGLHTQLRLAIAVAVSALQSIPFEYSSLAQRLSRGGTSGIGSLGFWHGGIIFDGGHQRGNQSGFLPSSQVTSPKKNRLLSSKKKLPFVPVIAQARGWNLVHGKVERDLFSSLTPIPGAEAKECARLVYQKLQSAVDCSDFLAFCETIDALQNVGFKKREIQYRGNDAILFKKLMMSSGLQGVGMSSWGPTWYGFAANINDAEHAIRFLSRSSSVESAWIADFAPGAQIEFSNSPSLSALSVATSNCRA